METKIDARPQRFDEGHRVSALGLRLREIRKQLEAATARGETVLLNRDQLDSELEAMRERDSNVP